MVGLTPNDCAACIGSSPADVHSGCDEARLSSCIHSRMVGVETELQACLPRRESVHSKHQRNKPDKMLKVTM